MSDYEITTLTKGIEYGNKATVGVSVWGIIAVILSIIGGILLYFLFVKAKEEPKNKYLKWLKEFLSFKIMWIEPLLKIAYYIATIFVILFSFSLISISFVTFLVVLVLGPIGLRLGYEAMMMFIMIWQNTRDIAENTGKKK